MVLNSSHLSCGVSESKWSPGTSQKRKMDYPQDEGRLALLVGGREKCMPFKHVHQGTHCEMMWTEEKMC